jgi:hypothetical protein
MSTSLQVAKKERSGLEELRQGALERDDIEMTSERGRVRRARAIPKSTRRSMGKSE